MACTSSTGRYEKFSEPNAHGALELIGVLVPHDPRQLGRGVMQFAVADQIGFAAGHQLFLHVGDRHGLGELLRLAAGAEADIDDHVVAGLPSPWIYIDPRIAQPHRLLLLAVFPDRAAPGSSAMQRATPSRPVPLPPLPSRLPLLLSKFTKLGIVAINRFIQQPVYTCDDFSH
jgi:hypothetical protein